MIDKLLNSLKTLWLQRRREVNDKYHRTLPLSEYIVDRWEKARELGFGEGTSVYDSVHIFGDVSVGKDTWIGPCVILDGSGKLSVGSNCSISAAVHIYTHDTVKWAISGGDESYEYAETRIGNNCYIGPHAVIAKGVVIGDGCIIGAHSLVLKNIPANRKAFGNPCEVVGSHDKT
jgi:acetyltransferase-like isoleucine patch superfamily enzyme